MMCPCGGKTSVTVTKTTTDYRVRRKRECKDCGLTFDTCELSVSDLEEIAQRPRHLLKDMKRSIEKFLYPRDESLL